MKTSTPEAVIAAYRDRLEALTELLELVKQEFEALQGLQPELLQEVVEKLGESLEHVEELQEAVRVTRNASGWTAAQRDEARELLEQTSTVIEGLTRYHSTNEALASRSLLLARYCIALLTGTEGYGPYGARGQQVADGSVKATLYSRRG